VDTDTAQQVWGEANDSIRNSNHTSVIRDTGKLPTQYKRRALIRRSCEPIPAGLSGALAAVVYQIPYARIVIRLFLPHRGKNGTK
jgi:hypothetical protein